MIKGTGWSGSVLPPSTSHVPAPLPHTWLNSVFTVFDTLVSGAVPQTSGLSKWKNKCGWVDGWGQICDTSRASVFVALFVIHLDLPPLSICTRPLQPACCRLRPLFSWGRRIRTARQARHRCRFIICAVAQKPSQLCLPWTPGWV